MTERSSDPSTNTPLNPAEPEGADKVRQLMGERRQEDQSAIVDYSEIDSLHAATPTELAEGEPSESLENERQTGGEIDSLDMLTEQELRADETNDPIEAIEEGYTYVPPIDPPVVPGDPGDYDTARVASGFAGSSLDEAYNVDTHSEFVPADDEMVARVRDALRADSSTNAFAARITIAAREGIITLRGRVDDMVDSDNALAVAGYVEGVEDVVDEIEVRGM
ncbi:MAG: BON domain-containing protein [Roseiflexaceae bacterium]|nr:BON domain-containing protein [Roseiflexaceae bacterium]